MGTKTTNKQPSASKDMSWIEWILVKVTSPLRWFSEAVGNKFAHIYLVLTLINVSMISLYMMEHANIIENSDRCHY